MAKEKSGKSDQEEILKIARERFEQAADAESKIRKVAREDILFSVGEQWDHQVRATREMDKRPCLTVNRLPQFIRQITNDQRQNKPATKVSPVDDNSTVEIAEVFQGMVRHIEYVSNADTAYNRAFDSAVRCGFGYWRIVTDYCSPDSFDQEIKIKSVRNAFSVYLDPSSQEPDGSDANWGFIFEDIPQEVFKREYPNSELASMDDWSSVGDNKSGHWLTKDTVRVAEYFFKEWVDDTLHLLADGSTLLESEVDPKIEIPQEHIQSSRKTKVPKIRWLKINAIEVLEETEWLGKYIPIVPVYGDEIEIDGELIREGVVRHAKDPQRMLNYWESAKTETIALAPRAPFIGAAGSFEGYEGQWRQANVRNYAYLEYNSKNGSNPPPQRQVYEPPVQAITAAAQMAADHLKETTGIYDASLGQQAPETSGVAIQRRTSQAQTSNFHYVDNLSKSIRHSGRILVDLIPKVYDTKRAVRILHEDDSQEIIVVNGIFQDQKGKTQNYQLDSGTYDVIIDHGPSFQTKREQAAQGMVELAKANPQVMQLAGDLLVKNLDWPGAGEVADRLKKAIPPQIVGDDPQNQIPPQVKAQLDQAHQMIDELTKHLNHRTQQIESKSIELESKERIAMAQIDAQIRIALAQLNSKESVALLQEEVAAIKHREQLLNFDQPIGQDQDDQQDPSQGSPQPQVPNGPQSAAGPQGMAAPQGPQAPMQPHNPTGGLTPG